MNANATYASKIRRLLQTHTVMSLKQLRQALNGRARSSLFRDVKKLDLITSYSHTGQYHALGSTPTFDEHGLWFYDDIGFSRYGTLKATLVAVVGDAEAGMTHKELKRLLRVAVQNTLTELVKSDRVGRRLLPNQRYLYMSHDRDRAEAQWHRRLRLDEQRADAALPPESVQIQILLEVIRGGQQGPDEQALGSKLRQQGIAIQDRDVAYVLVYYDIKKNGL